MEIIRIQLLIFYVILCTISVLVYNIIAQKLGSKVGNSITVITIPLTFITSLWVVLDPLNIVLQKYFAEWYDGLWHSHLAYPTYILFIIWINILLLLGDIFLYRLKSKYLDKK